MFKHLGMWTWPDAISTECPTRMAERLHEAHIDLNIPYLCSRAGGEEKKAFDARLHNLIEEAHRRGQSVYGCFDEINAYEAMPVYHLRQAYKNGELNSSLCPANPQVVDYVLNELSRYLRDFDLDGINLEDGYVFHHSTIYDPAHTVGVDYRIEDVCYCDYCKQHAPLEKPEWKAWKQEKLTELIAAQSKLIRQMRPDISFSAAARIPYDARFYEPYRDEIPYYSGWTICHSRDGFSADWAEWLRRGHLDFVCPMSYHHNDRLIELELMECRSLIPQAKELVWIGLGLSEINSEYSQGGSQEPGIEVKIHDPAMLNDASTIERQMNAQAQAGQQNLLFFSYAFLRDEHIPVIAKFRESHA